MRLRWVSIFAVQVLSLVNAGDRAIPIVCVIWSAAPSGPAALDEGDRQD